MPKGRRFYFDQIGVAQKSIGGFKVWDMCGWAVLPEEADEFEPLGLAGADREPAEDGSTPMDGFCDVTVTWEERDGKPFAHIVHYGLGLASGLTHPPVVEVVSRAPLGALKWFDLRHLERFYCQSGTTSATFLPPRPPRPVQKP